MFGGEFNVVFVAPFNSASDETWLPERNAEGAQPHSSLIPALFNGKLSRIVLEFSMKAAILLAMNR